MTRTAHNLRPAVSADQDVQFTAQDFRQIADFMYAQTGIKLTDSNERMVFARLCRRVSDLGFDRFADYVALATGPKAGAERDELISALTTNTTHFYRESHHFDFLRDSLIPQLVQRAQNGERIRLWSAACSSGEEAYSLAYCLARHFPEIHRYDVKILATDIDMRVLAQAEKGLYGKASLREMPKDAFGAWIEPSADGLSFQVSDRLKAMVTFRPLNLIGEWPFRGPFDIIFCRNVAIYMDHKTQEHIWSGFQRVLRQGGHLFIGHSERLSASLKDSFQLVGTTIYRHGASADRTT